jgi:RHS repeat-associated protein
MRKLSAVLTATAITALVVPLAAISPAVAVESPSVDEWALTQEVLELEGLTLDGMGQVPVLPPAGTPLPSPPGIWSPPTDSAGGATPDDQALPTEQWAPQADTRFKPAGTKDGTANRAPAGTVAGAPGTGELPWFSFQDFPLSTDSSAQVNLANGNLLVKANDLTVPVPGYGLRHDRYYNGLSTLAGSQGGGWQSNNAENDIGFTRGGTIPNAYIDVYGPSGLKLRFNQVGGTATYTSPAGSNMTLRPTSEFGSVIEYVLTHNQSGEQFRFSPQGWLKQTVDRNGVGETYYYSASKLTDVTNANGRGILLDRTTSGTSLITAARDTAGRKVEYTYAPTTNALKTVKSVDGKITTYNYDSTGRLSSIVLPSAGTATTTVTFTYDSSHRVTKVSQQPGIETTFTYTAGQTVVTDSNGHAATYGIDSSGRVTSTKDALNRTRTQEWTANSDISKTTDAFGTGNTVYTYDGSNNRTSAQLPTGAAAAAVYAIGANCSAPNTGTAFQPKCSTDDAGNKKQYEYDAAGNQTKQTDTTGPSPVVEFERTYGTCGGFAGQVCTTKDGNGNVTTYAYNSNGDMTSVTPPAPMGATTYTYDALGRVTSVTDGRGDTTEYQYDVRDRIVLTTFEDGQNLVSTYYDNGLEHSRTDSGGGAVTYEYDAQGRLTKQQGPQVGVEQSYGFDEVGNMLTYTDQYGTVTYTYDAANQLSTVTDSTSAVYSFEYDQNGAETKRTFPSGATTQTMRDASGRATQITARAADGSVAVDIGYNYGTAGTTDDRVNLRSRTSFAEQGIAPGAVTSYTYDSRNRLTLANETANGATTASWAYAYDAAGNRTQQTRTGTTGVTAGTVNYGYNAANQLTSSTGQATTWLYDTAGQQTRNGATGITSTYGDRHELTQESTTSSSYFGVGNTDRLSTSRPGNPPVNYAYVSSALGLMSRTLDNGGSSSTTLRFTRTPSGEILGARGTATWSYIADDQGSIVGLFSGTGNYYGGYSYSPYGEIRSRTINTYVNLNPIRYIGQIEGKLGARYYDASIGRFTQMDPSGQEKNPYAYAGCNPISNSDPTGLAISPCGAAAAWLGIGSAVLGVAALVLAPFTGGVSIPLAAGALGALSTATGITGGVFGVYYLASDGNC